MSPQKTMSNKESSEFGKGLCYCLGLFLAHQEGLQRWIKDWEKMRSMQPKNSDLFKEGDAVEMFFNYAADHFFEIQDGAAPKHLRKRVKILKEKCLGWRLSIDCKNPIRKDDETVLHSKS